MGKIRDEEFENLKIENNNLKSDIEI